jgi:proline dehydrogenase
MLRSLFISLSKANRIQGMIMNSEFAWRSARRFVAGVDPGDAIQVVRDLNSRQIVASLDHLGENTLTTRDAEQATDDILALLDQIKLGQIIANVSIKLTQIGMALDGDLCRQYLVQILDKASKNGNFIRLDMEESQYVDQTLSLYKEIRKSGYENLGVVIQAYLYRSNADVRTLEEVDAKVRLCKGAYQEPASRAFPHKSDVDANFDTLVRFLFEHALTTYNPGQVIDPFLPPIPAIATHDLARIAHAKKLAATVGLPKEAFEFQMLYGIRRELQENLAKEGYRVRVYIPYGSRWYPYYMRRLAERPANVWFFMSNLFRK